MAFKKTAELAAVTTAATTVLGTIPLGAAYGIVRGYQARNWASSAKAAAGTDTAEILELKDADNLIFFLDSADRDYATAAVDRMIAYDDLNTGLGVTPVTAIGVAWVAAEGQAIDPPVVKSPITVTIRNAGTATDYFSIFLKVEV